VLSYQVLRQRELRFVNKGNGVLKTKEAELSLAKDLIGECGHELNTKGIKIHSIDEVHVKKERELMALSQNGC